MNISQADCRAVFDAVSDAILVHEGATGEILEVNRGMCEMFGYTPEEARQLKVTALGGGEPGSQLESALSLLAKAAAGSPQVFEWQARDRAGRVFWVEVHLKPIRFGGRDRVLAVLRDIDRRKRVEEALQKSKTHYQVLFEDSPISLWQEDLTDLRAYLKNLQDSGVRDVRDYFEAHPEELQQCANLIKVVDINRATLEMYETDSKEQLLKSIASTFSPESYPAFKEAIIALAEGQTWFETETVTTTLSGRKNHILLRLHVLPGFENAGNEVLASIVDITESKRTAEALQTQTRVLESMAEGVVMGGEDDRILFTNPAHSAMFGYQPGELIGQPVSVLNDGSAEERARVARDILKQLQTTGHWSGKVRNRRKDGTSFYTHVRTSSLEIAGKKCWIAVQEDITERQEVEEALRQGEASYRIVTEGSLAGVYLIQDGKFRYVNPVLAQAFGYRPDEIIDRLGPMDLLHPEDRDRIIGVVERRLAGEGVPSRSNFKGLCQDGSVIHVETMSRQVEYQGRPAVMGTLLDVTERRLVEEALKASEEKYRTIFSAVNDAIVVIDPATGTFLEVNQKYLEMTGYDTGEAKELTLEKVCSADPPFTVQEAQELKSKAMAEGPQLFEWWAEDRSGSRFWVEINLTLTPLGGQDRLLAVIRDVSERKQAEDIRRRAYEGLERMVAERTAGLQSANAQLRGEIEERRLTEAIIRLQRDLALTLSGKMGLHETLRLCVETAIIISGLDSGGVFVVDPASGDLDLAYHQGFSPEFVRQGAYYEADDLHTYLVMAGRPVYARLQDLPGLMDEEGLKEGLRSVAIIPVIYQDRVIASINVASHQYEEVPATARAALETLAAQVGSAIARVQAEEALRRAKDDLEVRVAERTTQLQQANQSLEAELRVRQDIEKTLRYSEAKYRTLVEQIPAITYIVSLTAGLDTLYVSPQIEALLGFSPEEWRADNLEIWKRQIHPDDRERVVAEITHSIATGEPFATEYRLLAKSGRVVWFRDEARVVYDPEGQFRFLQGLALDITERKHAEEALRETTHTLQTLIQASPLAIMTLDLDFKISLWNPGAERMFGWKESEVLGGYLPCVPGDQLPEEDARLKLEMAGKAQSALELKRVRKDGSILDVHLWTASLLDANGKIIGIMGILADITERKRAEEELRRQAELLDLAHDAIIVRDLDNRVVFWNSGAEKTYGWGKAEVQGQEPHKLLHTEFPQPRRKLEAELFRQGQWQGELTHTRRDDRRIVVASRWAVQRDQDGKPAAILEINRDITGQKQAEAGRARLAAILEATSDLVGTADLEGRVLYLNRAGRKMLGIDVDEEVSRLTVKDLQPEWASRFIRDHGDFEALGPGVWSGETTFLSRTGQEIPTSQVVIVHKGAAGKVEFISTVARDITASKQAAQALQEANQRLWTLIQASPLALIGLDLERRVTSWNPAAERMFGWSQAEVMGRALPTIPSDQEDGFKALNQSNLQGIPLLGMEVRRQRQDGSVIDVSLSTAPLHDGVGAIIGSMGIIEDITEPKRMAETLRQVSRALKAITECHQALIRATDETELLNEVCRIIVEVGGYRMAWVGYAEADTHQSVRPVAQTGFDEGYVQKLNLTWADKERGRGPAGKAIRTGKPAICQDTFKDPDFAPWRRDAINHGFHSVLGLPLIGVSSFGALTIYAADPDAFDDEEINLAFGPGQRFGLWHYGVAGPGRAAAGGGGPEGVGAGTAVAYVPTPEHPGKRAPAGRQGIA